VSPTLPTLIGFNNDVSYRGLRFHIQTEDSGCEHPHVITHLFADGGYVVKSVRSDYSECVGHPERTKLVRAMMKKQHLEVALELRDGRLDSKLEHLLQHVSEHPGSGVGPVEEAFMEPPGVAGSTKRRSAQAGERRRHGVVFGLPSEESLDEVISSYLASVHDDGVSCRATSGAGIEKEQASETPLTRKRL